MLAVLGALFANAVIAVLKLGGSGDHRLFGHDGRGAPFDC